MEVCFCDKHRRPPDSLLMLAHVKLRLYLQGRFSRANSEETNGYELLALESYPPTELLVL